jgi:hypothetical protein
MGQKCAKVGPAPESKVSSEKAREARRGCGSGQKCRKKGPRVGEGGCCASRRRHGDKTDHHGGTEARRKTRPDAPQRHRAPTKPTCFVMGGWADFPPRERRAEWGNRRWVVGSRQRVGTVCCITTETRTHRGKTKACPTTETQSTDETNTCFVAGGWAGFPPAKSARPLLGSEQSVAGSGELCKPISTQAKPGLEWGTGCTSV